MIVEASFTLRNMLILLHAKLGTASIFVLLCIQPSLRYDSFDFEGIHIIPLYLLLVHKGANVVSIRDFNEVLLVLSHLRILNNFLQLFDLFQHLLILTATVLPLLQGILITSRNSSSFRLKCLPELSVLLLTQALEGFHDQLSRGILLVQVKKTREGLFILGMDEGLQPMPTVWLAISIHTLVR